MLFSDNSTLLGLQIAFCFAAFNSAQPAVEPTVSGSIAVLENYLAFKLVHLFSLGTSPGIYHPLDVLLRQLSMTSLIL